MLQKLLKPLNLCKSCNSKSTRDGSSRVLTRFASNRLLCRAGLFDEETKPGAKASDERGKDGNPEYGESAQENLRLNCSVRAIEHTIPVLTSKPNSPHTQQSAINNANLTAKRSQRRSVDPTKVNVKSILYECEATLLKLLSHDTSPNKGPSLLPAPSSSQLFTALVTKLIRQNTHEPVDLNTLHNMELQLLNLQLRKTQTGTASLLTTPVVKEALFALATAIWQACLQSPHYLQDGVVRRANDSFRPIFAGLLYSLSRGIHLRSGVCILPRVDSLADGLVTFKNASAPQRVLQSLSHRGLCALHKIISSYGTRAEAAFREAAFLSSELVKVVKRELGDR